MHTVPRLPVCPVLCKAAGPSETPKETRRRELRAPAWPLADELALCEALFALHRLRDPTLFTFTRSVTDAVELQRVVVPPMLLLPLAENSVKHGPGRGSRGSITLSVSRVRGDVAITLENPGAFAGPRPGGQGLKMVEQRLALAYGGRARLEIRAVGDRARVDLVLPADVSPEAGA